MRPSRANSSANHAEGWLATKLVFSAALRSGGGSPVGARCCRCCRGAGEAHQAGGEGSGDHALTTPPARRPCSKRCNELLRDALRSTATAQAGLPCTPTAHGNPREQTPVAPSSRMAVLKGRPHNLLDGALRQGFGTMRALLWPGLPGSAHVSRQASRSWSPRTPPLSTNKNSHIMDVDARAELGDGPGLVQPRSSPGGSGGGRPPVGAARARSGELA